ncbi:hypothetical protein ACFE04_027499 [Oxalis oulophora]
MRHDLQARLLLIYLGVTSDLDLLSFSRASIFCDLSTIEGMYGRFNIDHQLVSLRSVLGRTGGLEVVHSVSSSFTIYEDQLKHGLRLPFDHISCYFYFTHFELALAQLNHHVPCFVS